MPFLREKKERSSFGNEIVNLQKKLQEQCILLTVALFSQFWEYIVQTYLCFAVHAFKLSSFKWVIVRVKSQYVSARKWLLSDLLIFLFAHAKIDEVSTLGIYNSNLLFESSCQLGCMSNWETKKKLCSRNG